MIQTIRQQSGNRVPIAFEDSIRKFGLRVLECGTEYVQLEGRGAISPQDQREGNTTAQTEAELILRRTEQLARWFGYPKFFTGPLTTLGRIGVVEKQGKTRIGGVLRNARDKRENTTSKASHKAGLRGCLGSKSKPVARAYPRRIRRLAQRAEVLMALPEHLFDQMIAPSTACSWDREGVHHGTDRQPLTTYDVVIFPQTLCYTATVNLNRVPYRGQQAGGAIEQKQPFVGWAKGGGGVCRGRLQPTAHRGRGETRQPHREPTAAPYPQPTWSVNGVVILIDKDGNVSIQLPENKTLTIKDKDGNRVTKVRKMGA